MRRMAQRSHPQRPRGVVFVVSGPSGSGKGTVLRPVVEATEGLTYSVSATSRQPRPTETDGTDYHFVTRDDFARLLADDQLLEYTEYAGCLYGTPRKPVEEAIASGLDVVLEIETEGAAQVRKRLPDAVLILVLAPNAAELVRRLRERGTEDDAEIAERLRAYQRELAAWPLYDYLIVNDDVVAAREDLVAIIQAERCRASRLDIAQFVAAGFGVK